MNKPAKPKQPCLNPNCERPEYARGLCKSCYAIARKLVIQGNTTWARLEQDGKIRNSFTRITKWLLEASPEPSPQSEQD